MRVRCSFCFERGRYATEEGTAFCYWHLLLYFIGYDLPWHE